MTVLNLTLYCTAHCRRAVLTRLHLSTSNPTFTNPKP